MKNSRPFRGRLLILLCVIRAIAASRAPPRIQFLIFALSSLISFSFCGIRSSSICSQSGLLSGLPGANDAPPSPPFIMDATVRMSRPPFFFLSPWQKMHLALKIGRMSFSKMMLANFGSPAAGFFSSGFSGFDSASLRVSSFFRQAAACSVCAVAS